MFYELIRCSEPLQITWSPDGSSPPYYLSLIPGLTFFVTIFTLTSPTFNQRASPVRAL